MGSITRLTTDSTLDRDLRDSVAKQQAEAIEAVLIAGDLAKLTAEQRVAYYKRVCDSLGLNPLTKPFAYITLNGKLVLYALKDCTEQLRTIHGVSIVELTSQKLDDVFVVTAKARRMDGREDAATGAVSIGNLKGESLANALMKAETKAKRRATLSICGLGMLDETEAETLAAKEPQHVVTPLLPEAPPLPAGTARIVKVEPKRKGAVSWADITYVTAEGEEKTAAMPADAKDGSLSVAEQLCQDGAVVEIVTKVGRTGKTVVESLQRYRPDVSEPAQAPEAAEAPF